MLSSTDGHHNLVRWHLVTHCAIDGYSRMVFFQAITGPVSDMLHSEFVQVLGSLLSFHSTSPLITWLIDSVLLVENNQSESAPA